MAQPLSMLCALGRPNRTFIEQENHLADNGLVVRGTFIDENVMAGQEMSSKRRSRSLHSNFRLSAHDILATASTPRRASYLSVPRSCVERSDCSLESCQSRALSPVPSTNTPGSQSPLSSGQSTPRRGTSSSDIDQLTALGSMIERECSDFMEVGNWLVGLDSTTVANGVKQSSRWSIRFFVKGVSMGRRAHWRQPLFSQVADTLTRCGVQATMNGKQELFVDLEGGLIVTILADRLPKQLA